MRKEMLTYFSTKDIEVGSLVTIPLRKKEIPGIVLESVDALQNKSSIKEMDFAIKKIIDFNNKVSLPPYVMRASSKIAEISATSIGGVLASLIPKICFENPKTFFQKSDNEKERKQSKENNFEVLAMQLSNEDRMDTYRSTIRESFAKKRSIAIICPTEEKVLEIKDKLSKGITDYTIALSKTTSKKTLTEFVNKINTESHALLIIGTYYTLSLLNESVGTIILEEESSPFYKSKRRPFLHVHIVAKQIAHALNARLVLGDKLLSIETLALVKEGEINEYARIERRSIRKIQTLIVDIKPKEGEKKKFEVLSPDLKEMILYSIKSKKKIFIYSSRRGLASQTVCNDCGTTILCDNCESPITLHTVKDRRIFICHHCGKTKDAHENCKVCQSWNLVPLGIGIERIEEEIKGVTESKIVRIDSDNCKGPKAVKDKLKIFRGKDSFILLGTDLALKYLYDESVDFGAIVSLDSLFSLPHFRTNEQIMHIILDIKSKTKEVLLIQARNSKHKIIEQGLAGDLEGFANDEIKARHDFGYPPFMTIIKLSVEGKKDQVKIEANTIREKLKDYSPTIFPAFIKSRNGNSALNILIKVVRNKWPNKDLLDILLSFPPNVKIDTSPTSLL